MYARVFVYKSCKICTKSERDLSEISGYVVRQTARRSREAHTISRTSCGQVGCATCTKIIYTSNRSNISFWNYIYRS